MFGGRMGQAALKIARDEVGEKTRSADELEVCPRRLHCTLLLRC
jgi:hypothetical protein